MKEEGGRRKLKRLILHPSQFIVRLRSAALRPALSSGLPLSIAKDMICLMVLSINARKEGSRKKTGFSAMTGMRTQRIALAASISG